MFDGKEQVIHGIDGVEEYKEEELELIDQEPLDSDRKKLLLELSVAINTDTKEKIEIYEKDDVNAILDNFFEKKGMIIKLYKTRLER